MSKTEAQELKIYEVTNRNTGEKRFACGYSTQEACESKGWLIGDCYVIEQKPRTQAVPDKPPKLLYRVHCLTCPFQYAECRKPDNEDCPTRPSSPELQNWIKQAAEAHLCGHVGQELSKKDYNFGQKWVPMEQAIEELARTS